MGVLACNPSTRRLRPRKENLEVQLRENATDCSQGEPGYTPPRTPAHKDRQHLHRELSLCRSCTPWLSQCRVRYGEWERIGAHLHAQSLCLLAMSQWAAAYIWCQIPHRTNAHVWDSDKDSLPLFKSRSVTLKNWCPRLFFYFVAHQQLLDSSPCYPIQWPSCQ